MPSYEPGDLRETLVGKNLRVRKVGRGVLVVNGDVGETIRKAPLDRYRDPDCEESEMKTAVSTKWRDTELGEIITLQRGFDLPQQNRHPGKIPIVSSSGISDFHAESRVKGPGVVTGRYGTIGQVFFIKEDFWPLNTTLWVKDFKGNDPLFVSYFLRTIDFLSCSDKSSVPGVNRNDLHRIPARIPPLPEQKRIAHILGTLDDKIEMNRRMNETLEAMARALFKSWFVDFDPVRAKAARQKPEGMDDETAALFSSSFVDSELGKIPKGWRAGPMPEFIDIDPARTLRKRTIAPYVEMAKVSTNAPRVLGWINREYSSGSRFTNGDVLLARITPCLENGKTAYVDFMRDGQIGWGSTEFIVLRSKPPLPPEYVYILARQDDFRSHAITNMTGTSGRQRVPASCFSHYPMVVPTDAIAERFGKIVRPLFEKIRIADEEAQTLAEIRDALLPKLLSGEFNEN